MQIPLYVYVNKYTEIIKKFNGGRLQVNFFCVLYLLYTMHLQYKCTHLELSEEEMLLSKIKFDKDRGPVWCMQPFGSGTPG